MAHVLEVYSTLVSKELTPVLTSVDRIFSDLFSEFSKNYNLHYQNSANDGVYYSFHSRLKSDNSLKEKLVRKNLILNLKEDSSNSLVDAEEVKNFLYSLDDLLGFKIIGELEVDVEEIVSLLSENANWLSLRGIDIELKVVNPNATGVKKYGTPMKNGLDIYKFKCKYSYLDKSYNFELQVKSKLISAWGDMEHVIFYKDRLGSGIKESNQNIMNKVGLMITSIDHLLYSIRISNKTYVEQRNYSLFLEDIQKDTLNFIKAHLDIDVDIDLSLVASILYDFDSLISTKIKESYLDVLIPKVDSVENELYKFSMVFDELKKLNFEVYCLEYIYTFYSENKKYSSKKLNHDYTYSLAQREDTLVNFFEEYSNKLIKVFLLFGQDSIKSNNKKLTSLEFRFSKPEIRKLVELIFINSKNIDSLFLSPLYKDVFEFYKLHKDNAESFFSSNNGIEDFDDDLNANIFKSSSKNSLTNDARIDYFKIVEIFGVYTFSKDKCWVEDYRTFLEENAYELKDYIVYLNTLSTNDLKRNLGQFLNLIIEVGEVNE